MSPASSAYGADLNLPADRVTPDGGDPSASAIPPAEVEGLQHPPDADDPRLSASGGPPLPLASATPGDAERDGAAAVVPHESAAALPTMHLVNSLFVTTQTLRTYLRQAEDARTLTERIKARNVVRSEIRRLVALVQQLPPL